MAEKLKVFSASDYEGMYISVHGLKSTDDLLDTELGNYPEFRADLQELSGDRQRLLRYICLVYDPNSPFVKTYSDIPTRKIEAALMVGFSPSKNGRFPALVEHAMKCQNTVVNDMIIRFCRMASNRTYGLLVAANEFYWGQMKRLMTVKAGKDEEAIKEASNKSKLFDEAVKHEERISALERKFLAEDKSTGLNDTLWTVVDNEAKAKIKYSPEMMSKPK